MVPKIRWICSVRGSFEGGWMWWVDSRDGKHNAPFVLSRRLYVPCLGGWDFGGWLKNWHGRIGVFEGGGER